MKQRIYLCNNIKFILMMMVIPYPHPAMPPYTIINVLSSRTPVILNSFQDLVQHCRNTIKGARCNHEEMLKRGSA